MYSQCPECLTRFRVTAAALRAAHGTVRCGRCGSAFDALQRLTDAVPDDAEPSALPSMLGSRLASFDAPGLTGAGGRADSGAGGGDAEIGTDFHFSADDIEQVFIDARDWQKRFPRTAERAARETPVRERTSADDDDDEYDVAGAATTSTVTEAVGGAPVVFVHEPEAIEDITLEGERIVIEGLPEFDDELRQSSTTPAGPVVERSRTRRCRRAAGRSIRRMSIPTRPIGSKHCAWNRRRRCFRGRRRPPT